MKEAILLALGPSKELCRFDCGEVWGVNLAYRYAYDSGGFLTKLFLAHDDVFDWGDINRMSALHGFEVLNIHRLKKLESKQYPLRGIVKKFGVNYFTNTNCYMIAYAIYKGYDRLRLYGIDMRADEISQVAEKSGVEYWLGFAKAKGIEVIIPPIPTVLLSKG